MFVNTTPTPPAAANDTVDFVPLAGGRKLLLTSTSKAVTPFVGLASFIACLRQIGSLDQAARTLPFSYALPNAIPIAHTFIAFLLSVVVGASRFAHCDWLRFDSALYTLLGFKRFPGNDAVLHIFARLVALRQYGLWSSRVRFPQGGLRTTACWLALALPALR